MKNDMDAIVSRVRDLRNWGYYIRSIIQLGCLIRLEIEEILKDLYDEEDSDIYIHYEFYRRDEDGIFERISSVSEDLHWSVGLEIKIDELMKNR